MKTGDLPIYVADAETDPFERGKVPQPFVWGWFDGITYKNFWGKNCTDLFKAFLEDEVEPGIVYMHNGGRFDFFFILPWFQGKTMIVGSRIVRAFMPLGNSHSKKARDQRHEFRDSFAIMPFPLAEYKKTPIDYNKMHRDVREQHKDEIVSYLKDDCCDLWDLCLQFQQEFGDYKTIASAAFSQLTQFHKYEQLPKRQDVEIRESYYFGGRVQCFQKGIMEKPVQIYDVNSMYPFVMDTYFHPVSSISTVDQKVHGWNDDGSFTAEKIKTFFLTVEGETLEPGPFPQRQTNGSVEFPVGPGKYHCTIHEYLTALQLGLFNPSRIVQAYSFNDYSRFHLFVDHFYKAREKAKREGDKVHAMFYKYILNSAYGKFGLNPENYFNWEITRTPEAPKGVMWQLDCIVQDGAYYVWKQPNQLSWNVKNIGTAASITGAARSVLLRAISESGNVLYCDTDSVICEDFAGGKIDPLKLGAWKPEAVGVLAAIAGKKMYAVFGADGTCVKHANKGVDIKPEEIKALAEGQEVISWRDAPTFKRDGTATFIHRTVRMT